MFHVSITEGREVGTIVETVYIGSDYQEAFDAACSARANEAWRGKWIRFSQDGVSTKWAVIS